MQELMKVQLKLSKLSVRPLNYGILTSVIMHLIRSVVITPVNTLSYLNAALIDLNFGPVIERFGMFFLHDLKIETGELEGLESEDDQEVVRTMELEKKRRRQARAAATIHNSEPSAAFPFGNAPSWKEIVSALENSPLEMIRFWVWDEFWSRNQEASMLFIQMTVDLMLALSDQALSGERPRPTTMEEAMRCWTAESLLQTLGHCLFVASNHGLTGARTGRKQRSFKEMVQTFFPAPDSHFNPNSIWLPFVQKGYIRQYHQRLSTKTERQQQDLEEALELIFFHLQCLPMAAACQPTGRAVGHIWKAVDGRIQLITNPIFYRLEKVGSDVTKKQRVTVRVKASNAVIEARLDQEHRGIPLKLGQARRRQQQRSAKQANYRKPPQRSGKKQQVVAEEDDAMDVDKEPIDDGMVLDEDQMDVDSEESQHEMDVDSEEDDEESDGCSERYSSSEKDMD